MGNHKLTIVVFAIIVSILLIALAQTTCNFVLTVDNSSNRSGSNESKPAINMINESKIEYLIWPEYGNRSVLRSKSNNIAFTWGHEGLSQQFFYNNIFTYNLSNPEDYFCVPDDYIFAYGTNSSYRVKAVALNWSTDYRLINSGETAVINTVYQGNGFQPFASVENADDGNITISNWTVPPLDMTITHMMNYDESFVPMTITVKNKGSKPLRVIYVFQDGAWMTSFKYGNQDGVYQYWPDGANEHPRLWNIADENRNRTDNWVGMYDDLDGGMFAGTYAPPQSDGVRFHATWVATTTGEWGAYIGSNPSVFGMDNILLGINVPNDSISYNNAECKLHGTLIDFGVIDPGEEASQSIVKIMFTGYTDREDMRDRLDAIIQNITYYYESGLYLRDYQAAFADEQ